MESGFIERRRSPRVVMDSGTIAVRPVSMAVRLVDLSSEGVLIACPSPITPGAASRVIARLGDQPFEAGLEVRHVSSHWDPRAGGYRVGGRFVTLGSQAKAAVESLLRGSERRD